MEMIHYSNCPLCQSGNLQPVFSVKDYTVSAEKFLLLKCEDCSLVFTQDIPGQQNIASYYASQNYISHSNTQKGFINQLYHRVRNITLTAKRKMIISQTGIQQGKILDVGCGTGANLNEMKTAGWDITGLEPDDVARKNAVDLLYDEWHRKPVAISTASDGVFGGTQVITSLQFVLWKMHAWVVAAMFPVPKVQEIFDENGIPTDKSATDKKAHTFINELLWSIEAKSKMTD